MRYIIFGYRHIQLIPFLLLCIFWLGACGKDGDGGISDRLSGPEAALALPMRIDATVTPTTTTTPTITTTPAESTFPPVPDPASTPQETATPSELDPPIVEEREPSELETRLGLLAEVSQETTEHGENRLMPEETDQPLTPVSPSPTPFTNPSVLPESSPTPEPTGEATPKTEPTPEPTPTSTQKPVVQKEQQAQDEKATKKARKVSSSHIKIDELVVCSALSNRTPSGTAEQFSFAQVKRVYAWMKVSGATPPMRVKHRYYRDGEFVAAVSLNIKYPSMRTWSQKSFKGPQSKGTWKVVVTTDDEQNILAEKEFTLVP